VKRVVAHLSKEDAKVYGKRGAVSCTSKWYVEGETLEMSEIAKRLGVASNNIAASRYRRAAAKGPVTWASLRTRNDPTD
jgi:hypothetical protein